MKKNVLLMLLLLIIVSGLGASIYVLSLVPQPTKKEVIEKKEYYEITYVNSEYYYSVYNMKHKIVKKEGPLTKKPHIILKEDDLLQITIQTGTGIATQWGYFYDIKQNEFSQIFHSIYDVSDRKVAYGALNKVVVTDIYDDKVYYKEFSKFNNPLSTVAIPIISAKFNEDGKSIIVKYLSGTKYEVVAETLEL